MQYLSCGVLLILGLTVTQIHFADACSCIQPNPQIQVCDADFVAVFRIKKFNTADPATANYEVTTQEVFRANPEAKKALKCNTLLWTTSQSAACGRLGLQPGKEYILAGSASDDGQLRINSCGLSRSWSDMTSQKQETWRRFLIDLTCPTDVQDYPDA